jgi:hypothetical protein
MPSFSLSRRMRAATITALSIGAGVLSTAPAHAADASTSACVDSALSQPFAQWGDTNEYELAPGGSFDGDQTDWTLNGGASLVSGGDPYNGGGAASPSSISLPAGASAQSPFTCIDLSDPTFRLFARNNGDFLNAVLVQAVIQVPVIGDVPVPVGVISPSNTWKPSRALRTGSVLTSLLPGNSGEVALRFTSLSGSSQIDDVFVDPRMH